MKIALVHEFLTQYGGAERVLDAFLEIWPKAVIHTLIYDKAKMSKFYGQYKIKTSFLQKFPAPPPARYKWWLPLYPKAIESFDFSDYDLVFSDSSAFAKGVITKKSTKHICYMHTAS
ncbi:MAG: glycosyltransferase family 4 protein, partial [Patescibacteria group bacterium]|nr:glycosyltransferase family 4 protein [Patescibacteria group bacterium]